MISWECRRHNHCSTLH